MQASRLQESMLKWLHLNGNSKLVSAREFKLEIIYGWLDTFWRDWGRNSEWILIMIPNHCRGIGMALEHIAISPQCRLGMKGDILI